MAVLVAGMVGDDCMSVAMIKVYQDMMLVMCCDLYMITCM